MRRFQSCLLLVALACAEGERRADPASPATVSPAGFQQLRWLEGTWRGSESGGTPFFESYVFLNDTTIRSFTYPDSTFAQANDSGTIVLAGGQVTSRGTDATWIATRLDTTGVRFDPLRNAGNSFTWTRLSDTTWSATLEWRDQAGKDQERTYLMQRAGR